MLLELLLILANIGTAVVVFPILRRQNEILSLGYVTARIAECVFVAAGILFVLGIVSLRQDDPDAASLAVSLAALKDWTFLLGPGFIVGWGNGLILGYLMYRSGVLFDWWDAGTAVPAITVIPEFLWGLLLGIYCAVWGFKRDAPILQQKGRS